MAKKWLTAALLSSLPPLCAGSANAADKEDPDDGPGGTRLGLDLDHANDLDEDGVESGFGGALRLGHEYDLVLVSLTPELMASLHGFSGPADASHYAGLAGGRVTIGKLVEGGVFAHVGAGHVSQPDSFTGFALDLGLTLDLTILPVLDLGVHAAYDSLSSGDRDPFDFYRLGAHVVLAP